MVESGEKAHLRAERGPKEDEMDKATLLKTLTETRAAWEALLAQINEE